MALVTCPECNNRVSDQASSCPTCGFCIKAKEIEQTGKKWKGMQMWGVLLVCFSVVPCVAGAAMGGGEVSVGTILGTLCGAVGIVLFIWARIGAWWHHG